MTGLTVIAALVVSQLMLPAISLDEVSKRARSNPHDKIRTRVFTADDVRQTLAQRLSNSELKDLKIPFESTYKIRKLALKLTRSSRNDHQKLSALKRYFKSQGYLQRYARDGIRTAEQVFETGQGNCLSYANLFVAMARAVGLQAHYLDASKIVSDFDKSGSVLVEYGHVLVGVRIGPNWIAVDFDGRSGSSERFRVMSDLEAIADFYNNLGSELAWNKQVQGGFGAKEVLWAFDIATRIHPGFAKAWNNLGVALVRAGKQKQAIEAYERAIRIDDDFSAALANLGQLHWRRGNISSARSSFSRSVELESKNAHYRYFLARVLIAAGDEEIAIEHLKKGEHLDPKVFQIPMQLAQVHCDRQEWDLAEAAAQRVLAVIPGHRDATRLLERLQAVGRTSNP